MPIKRKNKKTKEGEVLRLAFIGIMLTGAALVERIFRSDQIPGLPRHLPVANGASYAAMYRE